MLIPLLVLYHWHFLVVHGFTASPSAQNTILPEKLHEPTYRHPFKLYMAKSDDGIEEEEDEEGLALRDDDWRAFRAKLVMGEKTSKSKDEPSSSDNPTAIRDDGDLDGIGSLFDDLSDADTDSDLQNKKAGKTAIEKQGFTPLDPSQWAYEAGDVIEQGAVILGGVEQEFGFGLRQQYFHKVAILVLDHGPTFTKGIILNRPTDLMLADDVNPGKKWRVWFGGDVEGLNARHPDITCLHSLSGEQATKASIPIMKNMQWTTFDNAKKLVKAGVAKVEDFWVFVGYAGWGPEQLAGELTRKSWYMVATDSQTLLQELARQGQGADPRDAGLDTWTLLMNMIGRKETADQFSGGFDDLMLKEWAFTNLLSSAAGGGAGRQERDPEEFNVNPELVETLISRSAASETNSLVGACVRASSAERSPFLLENQEMHKAVVLVVSDDDIATIGVILNRPSSKGIEFSVEDSITGRSKKVTVPARYGGQYAVKGQESLLYLHNREELRQAEIGSPVGIASGIWKCTSNDVTTSISKGIARPDDFIVVSGVSVWEKNLFSGKNGIEGEIDINRFEMIPSSCQNDVWLALLSQQTIFSESTFGQTISSSEKAWSVGRNVSKQGETLSGNKSSKKGQGLLPLLGLGENFDEEDDSMVFKTDVKVSKLSNDALRKWCATFLLGMPNLDTDSV